MGNGSSRTSLVPAAEMDAAALHALAVALRKPTLVSDLILAQEIDGLTALELDEAAVADLVSSTLDQKKVWAAVKQFQQSQEPSSEPSSEAVESAGYVSRRLADVEHEVWELRNAVEELRGRTARPMAAPPQKRVEDETLNVEERIRVLEDEILSLCDAAPQGSMLAANLPRLYYYRFGRNLDFRSLGFLKLSQLLAKMSRIEFDGSHRALVSKKLPLQQQQQQQHPHHMIPTMPVFYRSPFGPPQHDDTSFHGGEEDLLPSYLLGDAVASSG
mmetsp:Transcript_3308/g.8512  ORF Transcript_3308/g.8512 Transcript_3308/m.8512 type:complete len:273 (+) Transcript_3308:40-858(+)|eukprot:CAMPEP_0197414536 /NCGR_PEP_ID=MMETSP1170-20131217/1236_1 /TAXON_ID=54406 /ORGANISM="Sarcinochrysis sp, Strain CCMP770" /LENGTH=272 /DNA_ID=CAMNT_0042941257 /DNA_START=40 /DNA_END=858 /DNA_ORIENTATION=+